MGYEDSPEPVYAPAKPMRCVTFLWPPGRRSPSLAALTLVTVIGALGCASLQNVDKKTLPDGSYELRCRTRLSLCLVEMQDSCSDAGYDVLDAFEERKRVGPGTVETEIVRSHARIRCRKTTAVFGGAPEEPATAPVPTSTAPALPAPPPPVCQPGATQVCVGTGACQGGQQCLPDGSGFGACDCGSPAPAPIPPENPAPPAPTTSPGAAPAPVPTPAPTAPKPPGP
jgi:hypothetical protein